MQMVYTQRSMTKGGDRVHDEQGILNEIQNADNSMRRIEIGSPFYGLYIDENTERHLLDHNYSK